MIIRN